jgi:hypothetical protein
VTPAVTTGGIINSESVNEPLRDEEAVNQKKYAGVEMSDQVNRFYAAVLVLAGHGYIKQRLVKAYEENLAFIKDDELPIAAKQSFADLRHMMSRVDPLKGEGPIRASVRKMSVEEVDECAHKIIDLYGDMIRYSDNAQESLQIGDQQGVAPFLVKSG